MNAREDDALGRLTLKRHAFREPFGLGTGFVEPPLAVGEDQEIIDVVRCSVRSRR